MENNYEIFKDISNCPGYQISNYGRVKCMNTYRGGYIGEWYPALHFCTNGYLQVDLRDYTGGYHKYLVHRLVAEAFIPNQNNFDQVDHIDHNKENNNVSNLRWLTQQQNIRSRRQFKNNTSGCTGVTFNKQYGRWRAHIRVDGKSIHLGQFECYHEAVNARKNGEALYFN